MVGIDSAPHEVPPADGEVLRIAVCVKAVPGSTEVKLDPETHTIVRDGGEAVVNPFDATALEAALELREAVEAAGGRARVTVLSMGIPATERLLRDCIARGADDAVLLTDRAFAGADTLATTYALSLGIRHMGGVDVVLCGKMAVDGDTAQIGPELAGELGLSCATDVRRVEGLGEGGLRVRCAVDGGMAEVELPLPALATVAREAASPRMPSIDGVLAAQDAHVASLSAADLRADPARCGLTGSPTQVVRTFVPDRGAGGEEVAGGPRAQAARLADILGRWS